VIRNIDYVHQRAEKTGKKANYPKYLKDALKNNWAPKTKPAKPGIKIKPGMIIKLEGIKHTIDKNKCIWPNTDSCLPEGSIRDLLEKEIAELIE